MDEQEPKHIDAVAGDDAYPLEFLEPEEPWVSTGDWWLEDVGGGLFDDFLRRLAAVSSIRSVPEPDAAANPYRDIMLTPSPDDTPLKNILAELDAMARETASVDADWGGGGAATPAPHGDASRATVPPMPPVVTALPAPPKNDRAQSDVAARVPAATALDRGTIAAAAAGVAAAVGVAAAGIASRGKEARGDEPLDYLWVYLMQGQPSEPVPGAHLKGWIESGQMPSDTLVWREGLKDWIAASAAGFVAQSPAPAQPAPEAVLQRQSCRQCGTDLEATMRFCPNCGTGAP